MMSESKMPEKTITDAPADDAVAAVTVGAGDVKAVATSRVYAISVEESVTTTRMRPQAVVGAEVASDAGGVRAQCQCSHGEAAPTASCEAGGEGRAARPDARKGKSRVVMGWDRLRSGIMIGLIVLLVIWAAIFFPLISE